jgi:hypothetical protein
MPFADEAAKKQGVPGHWDPLHETYTAWPTTPLSVTQN